MGLRKTVEQSTHPAPRKVGGRGSLGAPWVETQTAVIDQDIQTVSLTTVLAHSSGEWIASDWPVCTLSEMASPRRMGAALTYARRYALFTLVGIAGEDDLDAPDGPPADDASKTGNGFDPRTVNGGSAAGTLGAFARNRKPWTPPKQALAPESTALRNRLLGELCSLASADDATAWAQRALGAKNPLRDVDAAVVEAAFASRLTELGDPRSSPPEAGQDPKESSEPPGRAELMAALRASVELAAAKEAAIPADRRRRKRWPREQTACLPSQPQLQSQLEVVQVNNAVVWHDRVPGSGVARGGSPHSPTLAGLVSWRLSEG
jgi:hypothetical protein